MPENQKALVLMSGGPDSFAAAQWAKKAGYSVKGLFFDVNHDVVEREKTLFDKQTSYLTIKQDVLPIGNTIEAINTSNNKMDHLFKGHGLDLFTFSAGITTSLAVSYAETRNISTLIFGLHEDDFNKSKEYDLDVINSIIEAANTGTADININLPFKNMKKKEVIDQAKRCDLPIGMSWSCTQSNHTHCGKCTQCKERFSAFDGSIEANPAHSHNPILTN